MRKLLMCAAIFALTAAAADDKAPDAKTAKTGNNGQMEGMKRMPVPPEARELRKLVGTWKSTDTYEKIEGMMPGGEGESINKTESGPGGYSIVMHMQSLTGPMAKFRGLGVLAWNPDEKVYKMAWVESAMPGLMIETGTMEGNDLVLRGEVQMMGKTYKVRDVMSDMTPTSYTLNSYMDDGSGEKHVMTVKATKEAGAAASAAKKPESK